MAATPEQRKAQREARGAAGRAVERAYLDANREKIKAQRRARYAADKARRDAQQEAARVRYATDQEFREAALARARERAASLTPEQQHEQRKARWQREKDRPHVHEAKLSEQQRLRREVIAGYGGGCECCGTTHLPHLTIDHVGGGGAEERRKLGRGSALYRRLRREGFPEGYRVLCFNCNWAMHVEGECTCQHRARLEAVS